ncbi:helix-turn-helix transcriptional regulator [Nostoc sp. PA-18-2419]|uniref:helix-turn-helix transcriptional regulator n=1 Tax=Nostoc sp. PA-18-2419 TaxID=2575443 RepID=UPI001675188A|nr:AraC family transcriptional regulator [Nostoc sp. PA-18-2419]
MTISISRNFFWEIYFEDEPTKQRYDSSDEFDILWQYPSQFGKGYSRIIELREGLGLLINDYRLDDRLVIKVPERAGDNIQYIFRLSGSHEIWDIHTRNHQTGVAGQYFFGGSGAAPSEICAILPEQHHLAVSVWMARELFCSFAGNVEREIPSALKCLISPIEQSNCSGSGTTTAAMQDIVQQILRCPYQGMTKRMYLESKALELMTLIVQEELEIKEDRHNPTLLKLDDVDRIHLARNILLRNLDNPPSLIELAKQAGINERKLKEGFRFCFGTTVFGYLHNYRMEQARSLLVAGQLSVKQVARIIGYASPTSFHAAFRKKFGINPGDYLKRC